MSVVPLVLLNAGGLQLVVGLDDGASELDTFLGSQVEAVRGDGLASLELLADVAELHELDNIQLADELLVLPGENAPEYTVVDEAVELRPLESDQLAGCTGDALLNGIETQGHGQHADEHRHADHSGLHEAILSGFVTEVTGIVSDRNGEPTRRNMHVATSHFDTICLSNNTCKQGFAPLITRYRNYNTFMLICHYF